MMSRTIRTATGLALGASVLSLAAPAAAQQFPMSQGEIETLPPEYQSGPVPTVRSRVVNNGEQRTVGADGVETIVRTRRIEGSAPLHSGYQQGGYQQGGYAPAYAPAQAPAYAPAATVLQREQWIDECEARTSGRSEKEKGQIIGGLFGAVAGGLLGNRVAGAGNRLGGTLIGAGAGGLGGALLGGLIGGGKKDGRYDCGAALDGYMSQYGEGGPRVGVRTIPAQSYGYPAYARPVQYAHTQGCACNYAQPQQVVYVPYEYAQRQRVIVRETVREETYEVPGATRTIEPVPLPAREPRMIKQPTRVYPAPSPKMIKQ